MIEWKDITGYSRGKERIPGTYSCNIEGVDIIVTRHIDYDNEIILRSRELKLDSITLGVTDIEKAKEIALKCVKEYLTDKIMTYEKIRDVICDNLKNTM